LNPCSQAERRDGRFGNAANGLFSSGTYGLFAPHLGQKALSFPSRPQAGLVQTGIHHHAHVIDFIAPGGGQKNFRLFQLYKISLRTTSQRAGRKQEKRPSSPPSWALLFPKQKYGIIDKDDGSWAGNILGGTVGQCARD